MRAWTYTTFGPLHQILKLRHDLPKPQTSDLKTDEVLIKVSNVALFLPETHLMTWLPHFNNNPWIPGFDFSGTIEAVGPLSSDGKIDGLALQGLEVGQRVFGMTDPKDFRYNGALVEYMIVPRAVVAACPGDVKLEEAAGLGSGGSTTLKFFERARLIDIGVDGKGRLRYRSTCQGKRVLICGGATNTGLVMIQVLRHLVGKDGTIVATCSPRNNETVKALGADETIDYTSHATLSSYLAKTYSSHPFDAIIDITSSDPTLYPSSPSYLTEHGVFAIAGAMSQTHTAVRPGRLNATLHFLATVVVLTGIFWNTLRPVWLGGVPRRGFFLSAGPNGKVIGVTGDLVREGVVRGCVDSVWRMEELVEAYDHLANNKTRGKVVIKVQD